MGTEVDSKPISEASPYNLLTNTKRRVVSTKWRSIGFKSEEVLSLGSIQSLLDHQWG